MGNEDDIPRELEGGAELELIDVNDVGKKIPLMLLKRKRQVGNLLLIDQYTCLVVGVLSLTKDFCLFICLDSRGE